MAVFNGVRFKLVLNNVELLGLSWTIETGESQQGQPPEPEESLAERRLRRLAPHPYLDRYGKPPTVKP